uniref:HECT domain-containing protein n=1 Tax=Arcella intermedia TaxID=1963864 RepID=A0A6B2L6T0_9EUKA
MVISRRNNSEPIFIQAFNIWKRIPNKALFRQSYSPLIINPVANGFGLMSAKQKRAFLVSFKDEDGVDEGGLYNEFFHEITNELMTSSKLKLFIRTPNHIREDGPEQYLFKTNPALGHQSDDAQAFELFEFVGVLIGIALRCEVVMGFNFPSLFWKYLVDEEVGNEDLERIDARLVASCKEIVDCKAEDYNTNFNDTTWSCVVSSEQNLVHDLIPNGRNIKVSWEQRKEFTEKLIHFELHKKDAPHLEAIKRGISSIIPEGYLSMFSWKELESAICGDPVNIFELKKNAIYEDVSSEEEHVKFFWQVLEELTTEEQEKFLRFAWARSRMPPSGTNQGITISAPPSESRDNPDLFLPRSNTCSFKMHLPQYTTVQNARDKILYAINHCTELDRI